MVLSQRRAPLCSRFAHKLVDFILCNLESEIMGCQCYSARFIRDCTPFYTRSGGRKHFELTGDGGISDS